MVVTPSTSNFDTARRRHVHALETRLPQEVDKFTWDLGRLHSLRDQRLRELLRVAKERSPWHTTRLSHVDPATVTGDDLSAIPPMTKVDLMENWDDIVTDHRLTLDVANRHLAYVVEHGPSYLLDEYMVLQSSGSSGKRGVFVWDFEGWLHTGFATFGSLLWMSRAFSWPAEWRIAIILAAQATHLSRTVSATFAGPPGSAISLPITLPFSEIVAQLNAFQPTNVTVYPSMLALLAVEAQRGRLRISPRMINCGGEPLLPEVRLAAEQVFGAPVVNGYLASETGMLAMAFPGQSGMHLLEHNAVVEPVDAAGRPVPSGAPAAKLYVTNVVNQVLPLIRYELNDETTLLDTPNPGPWTGRKIADVMGRTDDIFTYSDGVAVHPCIFWSALGPVPEIFEYQVRQTAQGADISVRVTQAVSLETVRQDLMEALAGLGLPEPEVTIAALEPGDRLGETGKLKRFIPLVR